MTDAISLMLHDEVLVNSSDLVGLFLTYEYCASEVIFPSLQLVSRFLTMTFCDVEQISMLTKTPSVRRLIQNEKHL